MKNIAKTILLLSLILLATTPTILTAKAYTWPTLPSGPVDMTVSGGTSTYLAVTFNGLPSGYSVNDGTYSAWCGNLYYDIGTGPYAVYLYSSQSSSLPSSVASINWHEINYILNHKQGDSWEIQEALWSSMNDVVPPSTDTNAEAMIDEANANPTYQPGPGDILAVICLTSDWTNSVPNDNSIQPVVIEIQTPSTSTTSTSLSSSTITLGESVNDVAIVTGTATGQVNFEVSTDGTTFTLFSTKMLSGDNPSTATSDSYTPLTAGTYYFRASYQGNNQYFNSQSGDGEEQLTVTPAAATVATTLNATSIPLGQAIHDTATVTGLSDTAFPAPTGSVTFWVSTDANTWNQVGNAAPLVGNTATSADYTPPAVGTYYFQAQYSGDSNYNTAYSEATAEMFDTTKAPPTVTTILSQTCITIGTTCGSSCGSSNYGSHCGSSVNTNCGTSCTSSSSVTDTAKVTGVSGFPVPTGTVTFQVSTDNAATWNNYGTIKTLVNGKATSDSYKPTVAGTYYFRAVYSGDSNYLGAQSGNKDEPLVVKSCQKPTTTTTCLSSDCITLGKSVTDVAFVTKGATGQVRFEVSTDGINFVQFGNVKTLSGGCTNKAQSDRYTPTAVGTYYFRAVYLGDGHYLGSQSGNNDEILTVKKAVCSYSGLSPGFWKNHQCLWQGNKPCDSFNRVFGVSVKIGNDRNPTLLEALQSNGGGVNALARQAAAALLNSEHQYIHYPLTKSQITNLVQNAIKSGNSATIESLTNQLETYNNLGGGIDAHGHPI